MGERMIADLMSVSDNAFDEIGICLAVLADDEKCSRYVFLFENIQNFRRPDRIGAVVEGEHDLSDLVTGSLNDV